MKDIWHTCLKQPFLHLWLLIWIILKCLPFRSSSKSGPASSKKSGPASSKKSEKSDDKKKSKEAVSSDSDSDDFVSSAKPNGTKKSDDKKDVDKSDDDDDEKTFKVAPIRFR